ncbi:hypothetical protein TNCV_2420971 [Trichonephila clavipes]|uniref:Uncharacterized protein n=1 Tax=Trichonephila clavipes TaxID=2585209 RepID=A0A8X6R805_TRICX|nr:hypothetical protein TNCV_2420971 [Trichonephila clavipes]
MTTNTGQDVSMSSLGHIVIRTRRINFKIHHMPLSSRFELLEDDAESRQAHHVITPEIIVGVNGQMQNHRGRDPSATGYYHPVPLTS